MQFDSLLLTIVCNKLRCVCDAWLRTASTLSFWMFIPFLCFCFLFIFIRFLATASPKSFRRRRHALSPDGPYLKLACVIRTTECLYLLVRPVSEMTKHDRSSLRGRGTVSAYHKASIDWLFKSSELISGWLKTLHGMWIPLSAANKTLRFTSQRELESTVLLCV